MEAKDIPMQVAVEAILLQIEKYRHRSTAILAKEKMLEGVNKSLKDNPEDPQLLAEKKEHEKEIKELRSLQTAFQKCFNILSEEIAKIPMTA